MRSPNLTDSMVHRSGVVFVFLAAVVLSGQVYAQLQPTDTPRKSAEIPVPSRHSAGAPSGDAEAAPVESSLKANARALAEHRMSGFYRPAIGDPGLYVNGNTDGAAYIMIDSVPNGDVIDDFPVYANCVLTG